MEYFEVLRNGKMWSNFIESEDLAHDHIIDCVSNGDGDFEDFEVVPMVFEDGSIII